MLFVLTPLLDTSGRVSPEPSAQQQVTEAGDRPRLRAAPRRLCLRAAPRRRPWPPGSLLWNARVGESDFGLLLAPPWQGAPGPDAPRSGAPLPGPPQPPRSDASAAGRPASPRRAVHTHHLTRTPIGCCLLLTHVIGAGAPRLRTPPPRAAARQRVPAGHRVLRRPPG